MLLIQEEGLKSHELLLLYSKDGKHVSHLEVCEEGWELSCAAVQQSQLEQGG